MGLHLQTTKHVWPSYLRKLPPNHTRQPGLNQKHKLSSVTGFVVQKSRDLLIFSSFFHLKRSEKTVGIARSHRSPRSEDRLKVVFEASTKTGRKCWENPEIFISLFWFMVEISMVYTPEYEYLGVFIIFISLFWFMVEISMVYTPEYEYLGVFIIFISLFWFMVEISMVYTPEYEYLGVFIIFISLFWFMVEISMVYTPEYEYLGVFIIFISLFWFMVEISMVYTPEYDMNILGFYHIHIIILVEISIPTMVYKPT